MSDKHREEEEKERRPFQGWEGWIAWFVLLPSGAGFILPILVIFEVIPNKSMPTGPEAIGFGACSLVCLAWGIYWVWLDRKEHGGKSLTENRNAGGCCIMPFFLLMMLVFFLGPNPPDEPDATILFALLIPISMWWGSKQVK